MDEVNGENTDRDDRSYRLYPIHVCVNTIVYSNKRALRKTSNQQSILTKPNAFA